MPIVVAITLTALAACHLPAADNPSAETEGTSVVDEGSVPNGNADSRIPDGTAVENPTDASRDPTDSLMFEGRPPASVTTDPSNRISWGVDQPGSDSESRLIQEQMRLQGRIDILDRQLRAFDTNPPSRSAREADRRGRPEAIERRLDLERRTLEAQERQTRRDLRRLRSERLSVGPGRQERGSQSLFGGADR